MAIEAELELASGPQRVARLNLEEALSEGVSADVEVVGGLELDLEESVGRDAVLLLTRDGEEPRRWSLYVTGVRFAGLEGGLLRYVVTLRDRLWRLELARATRKFRNQSVQTIVEALVAEHGLEVRWSLTNPTQPRNYTVQYRETSRHFMSRLLEQEGIYFQIGADGALEAADDSPRAPFLPGAETLPIIEVGGALQWSGKGVDEVRCGARLASGTITLNDYNWKTPAVDLRAGASAARDRDLEIYDYPSGYRDPATGRRLAALRLEAERALARWCEGGANVVGFAPGYAFELTGEAAAAFARDYLLVRVKHSLEVPSVVGEGDTTYHNDFVAIPRDVPFRPALTHARPVLDGNHTAMVRGPAGEEIHTDRHGRFKSQFHWDREATETDDDSRWLRILQESASGMTLARVGWEMSVAYIDGDPDRPLGIARQINGVMTTAYQQPSNKTMMAMKTPSSPATGGYNELKLDDRGGAMRFDLRSEKDLAAEVKHDRTEQIGHDELHVVGDSASRQVTGNQTITIGANATAVVNVDDSLNVIKNRKKTVGGNEKVDVGAADEEATVGNDSEKVGSVRLTIAGGVGLPSVAAVKSQFVPSPKSVAAGGAVGAAKGLLGGGSAAGGAGAALKGMVPSMPSAGQLAAMLLKGSIQRTAATSTNRKVGGAMISAAVGAVSTKTKLGFAETVGGAKLTLTGGGIQTGAGLGLITTVGGAIIRSATGDIGYSAKIARISVGGVAKLTSTITTTVKATMVMVSAAATLALEAGGASIKLTPGKATIKGDLKLDAGGKIKVTGNPDNVTKA